MQDFRSGLFTPLLFQVTATELQDAPEKVQAVYAELLLFGAEIIEATENALELADAYQEHGISLTAAPVEACRIVGYAKRSRR